MQTAKLIIQVTQRRKIKPWFNKVCKIGIKDRNDTRIKAIQTPTPENIRQYEATRKEVNKLLIREKRAAEKRIKGDKRNREIQRNH